MANIKTSTPSNQSPYPLFHFHPYSHTKFVPACSPVLTAFLSSGSTLSLVFSVACFQFRQVCDFFTVGLFPFRAFFVSITTRLKVVSLSYEYLLSFISHCRLSFCHVVLRFWVLFKSFGWFDEYRIDGVLTLLFVSALQA